MIMTRLSFRLALAVSVLPLGTSEAQSIAQRVGAVQQGDVELRFAARPGACGDGRSFISLGRSMRMTLSGTWRSHDSMACVPGPVRVRLSLADGIVTDVRTFVGPLRSDGAQPVTDLGVVPARAAANFFLQIAAIASGRAGDKAIMPAILADSASVWRGLLAVA